MATTLNTLSWAQTIGFSLTAVITVAAWLYRPNRERGWLALAVGLLGLVSVVGRVEQVTATYPKIVTQLTLPAFLLSGLALFLYRHTVMPVRRSILVALLAAMAMLTAASFIVTLPTGVAPSLDALQWAFVLALFGLWAASVGEPAVQFWLVSARLPSVQRARLRALSLGYGGIVLLLLTAVFAAILVGPHLYTHTTYQLSVAIAGTAAVPLLYMGFAPPRVLRLMWTRREEMALRRAFGDLLIASRRDALLEHGLEWSIRIVGGEGGVLAGPDGEILASTGVDSATARSLATIEARDSAHLEDAATANRAVLVCPLPLHAGTGVVAVIAGPFTPSLGGDEISRLAAFAFALSSALERMRLADALAQQAAWQASVLHTISDLGKGCVVIEDGRVVFANEAYCSLTGRSPGELMAMSDPVDVVVEEHRAELARRIELGVADGTSVAFMETALIGPDGTRVEVELAGKAVQAGGQYIVVCRDVSERRRARDELERSNADLQQFAYVASHDLQEPLRMVASYLQLLARRYDGHLDTDGQEFLAYAVDGARRMQTLITDLLQYSRAGSVETMQAVDCDAVLRIVLSNLQSAIAEAGARVVVEPLPTIFGNQAQLVQVFQNLVSNALKFRGDAPPLVTISAETDARMCCITVRDNGIGIEERHRERIFMIFKRLHTHDQYPGTGIGLAICRRIVERHGGRIWVEAAEGGGSEFRITLPAARMAASPPAARQAVAV